MRCLLEYAFVSTHVMEMAIVFTAAKVRTRERSSLMLICEEVVRRTSVALIQEDIYMSLNERF